MANSIVRQPWRLGVILLLLAAFIAGLLIVQISRSGSPGATAGEGPIVEQAGTVESESGISQPRGPRQVAPANSAASSGNEGFAGLTTDAGSSFYVDFVVSPNSAGGSGNSLPPSDQTSSTGSLSGTVLDATTPGGGSISRVTVYLARTDGVFTGATAMTGDDGDFLFDGLAPGEYKLYFFDLAGSWKAVWYGAPAFPTGSTVNVSSGRVVHVMQGLEHADPEDGAITGRVTDAAGNGVAGVDVLAYLVDEANGVLLLLKESAVTDAAGNYQVSGLSPSLVTVSGDGSTHVTGYKVQFIPSGTIYSSQWYAGQSTHQTAKLMELKPAEKLAGIDAILTAGGTISGRITLESGQPASSALVDIFNGAGVIVDTQIAATDGSYQSDTLPAGTYHLRATPRTSEYSMEWYNNGNDMPSSTAIQVLSSQDTGGINMVLEKTKPDPAAAVEPTIGDSETLVPREAGDIENARVQAVDSASDTGEEQETDDSTALMEDEGDGFGQESMGSVPSVSAGFVPGQTEPSSAPRREPGKAADK